MKIMKIILSILSFGGLDLSEKEQHAKCYNFVYIFWLSWIAISIFGCIKYFVEHLHHLSVIFQVTMFVSTYVMIFTKVIICVLNKRQCAQLLYVLQNNYDLKENQPEINLYKKAEKYTKIYFICFFTSIAVGITLISSQPLIVVLYNQINGTLKPSHWIHPIPLSFYFNASTSPGYEIIYIITCMTLIACNIFLSGVDSLYFGTGLHIVAAFKELQLMLTKIDDIWSFKHGKSNEMRTDDYYNIFDKDDNSLFFKAIKEFIEFHSCILNCQQAMQNIYGANIFITMFAVILILCSTLFRASNQSNIENDKFLLPMMIYVVLVGALIAFNSTYIGSLITAEGINTADAAYHKLWYNRTPAIRKYYLFLIQIGQKPRFLHGLHFFNCSMETFSNIIKASFSVLAVMHNVE